jgi:hypothetical protein
MHWRHESEVAEGKARITSAFSNLNNPPCCHAIMHPSPACCLDRWILRFYGLLWNQLQGLGGWPYITTKQVQTQVTT